MHRSMCSLFLFLVGLRKYYFVEEQSKDIVEVIEGGEGIVEHERVEVHVDTKTELEVGVRGDDVYSIQTDEYIEVDIIKDAGTAMYVERVIEEKNRIHTEENHDEM